MAATYMKPEEIRRIAESWADLASKNEPGIYERATVTFLGLIAAAIVEANAREEARKWTPPTTAEGSYTAQILDILGAPQSDNGNALNIQERVAWLLNKRDGVTK